MSKECTKCKVKFSYGSCPKCRSYSYVREAYSGGSTYSYETHSPSSDYNSGDGGSSSSGDGGCSSGGGD